VLHTQDDLFSQKMGSLLIDQFVNENEELKKHILILLLIHQRPRNWKIQVQNYITSIAHNSFYLMDVYRILKVQYRYSYATQQTLKDIEYLIKLSAAKHKSRRDLPGEKFIKRISNDNIPPREADRDL